MILAVLNGGLGNQLFQYALGRRLALKHGVELRFDLSLLEANPTRQYRLDKFQVRGKPASAQELERFYYCERQPYFRFLDREIQNALPYYRRRVVREISTVFDANVLKAPRNTALDGYWQSEKYFREIRPTLLDELRLKNPLDALNQNIYHQILSTNSVSLHIRRGDYVTNPVANQILGVLSIEYYQNAMHILERAASNLHYYVFSDDIPWARAHLTAPNITFLEHNSFQSDYCDLVLMSACKRHIIANSSFSWWAAWLCLEPNKIVIAPKKWFNSANMDSKDIFSPDWVQI